MTHYKITPLAKPRNIPDESRSRMGGSTRFKPKHGMRNTVEYHTWSSMIARCTNPNCKSYKSHGARGISICDEWYDFKNFFNDMGFRPTKGHSLDRIDNDGDYNPKNTRWATRKQQQRNKRNNIYINYEGKVYTLVEICELKGKNHNTVSKRLKRGLPIEIALEYKSKPKCTTK